MDRIPDGYDANGKSMGIGQVGYPADRLGFGGDFVWVAEDDALEKRV
jgi:hypothetical protein